MRWASASHHGFSSRKRAGVCDGGAAARPWTGPLDRLIRKAFAANSRGLPGAPYSGRKRSPFLLRAARESACGSNWRGDGSFAWVRSIVQICHQKSGTSQLIAINVPLRHDRRPIPYPHHFPPNRKLVAPVSRARFFCLNAEPISGGTLQTNGRPLSAPMA